MAGPAARLAGVTVRRGGVDVLREVDVEVPTGRVVGLLGPSGGGKTTILRTLVGVQQRVAGEVEVLGLPAGSPELRSRVAYVTQAASVYPDLTAEQNLRYFAASLGLRARDRRAAVSEALARVDLAALRHRLVGRLSGGQRSRVSLAGALLGTPELLVLDEPTVGLDPLLRRELWELFHRLAAGGATVLVSSHVMDEAARCDDLVLVHDGRVLARGSVAALRDRTGTADVEAAFVALVERGEAAGRDRA